MDLSKQKDEMKLYLSKTYFFLGFACLPFLWAINFIWFYKDAFRRAAYPEQKAIRKYSIMSAMGASVWAVGLIAWIAVYQTNRASWGEQGDNLSFVIPYGRA